MGHTYLNAVNNLKNLTNNQEILNLIANPARNWKKEQIRLAKIDYYKKLLELELSLATKIRRTFSLSLKTLNKNFLPNSCEFYAKVFLLMLFLAV